jgi:phosphoinositide-3-kinase regulatory subunit 4
MGNTIPSSTAPAYDLHVVLADQPQYLYQDLIGRGKFLKTVLCKHVPRTDGAAKPGRGGGEADTGSRVVVKVYLKRGDMKPADMQRRIVLAREQLLLLCRLFNLTTQPNLLPYQRFEDCPRYNAAIVVRQHVMYNLYDRLNTRPFLGRTEKLWVVYQLLRAAEQAHGAGVRHGDIKSENVLMTSWGWLLLTDFATFKPTFLREDDPADFSFFFESGGSRHCCCIAPERFVRTKDLEAAAGGGAGLPRPSAGGAGTTPLTSPNPALGGVSAAR